VSPLSGLDSQTVGDGKLSPIQYVLNHEHDSVEEDGGCFATLYQYLKKVPTLCTDPDGEQRFQRRSQRVRD